jgi:hypothetical protein
VAYSNGLIPQWSWWHLVATGIKWIDLFRFWELWQVPVVANGILKWVYSSMKLLTPSGKWYNWKFITLLAWQTLSQQGQMRGWSFANCLGAYQTLSLPGWQKDLHPLPAYQKLQKARLDSGSCDRDGYILSRTNDIFRYDISQTVIVWLMTSLAKIVSNKKHVRVLTPHPASLTPEWRHFWRN